jgi:hypothetical protein
MSEQNDENTKDDAYKPGKFEVSVELVRSISTTSNSKFDQIVHSFAHRMHEKSVDIFGKRNEDNSSSKSTD